jgi:hypothetical protein
MKFNYFLALINSPQLKTLFVLKQKSKINFENMAQSSLVHIQAL